MIKKEDALVLSLSSSNSSLRQENNSLANALVKYKNMEDNTVKDNLTYGALGTALGIALGVLVMSKH